MRATEIGKGWAEEDLDRLIDDWRRRQPSIPSRAQAVRLLVRKGLDSERVPEVR